MKPSAAIFALAFIAMAAVAQETAQPVGGPGKPSTYQLKNKSSFTTIAGTRAPFIPIGWVKKEGAIVVVQKANIDEGGFRVTSILLGNPSLAVVNGKSYEEGQFLRMPRGGPQIRIRVYRITDGQVWLQYEDKLFAVPLKRPEIGERKVEEPLLSEERDMVPMPTPPAGMTPVPGATPAPVPPVPKLR